MGGGVSLMEGVEELMTTTILIGRAISAVAFPGMYRLYDFHSKKAPKLKNAQRFTPFFTPDSDEEEENEANHIPNSEDYEHFFKVTVGEDIIYLEDPLQENEAGWTPLHTCCMSLSTVNAGLVLIDEILRRGGSLETKTKSGPGTFNKGWTALQMACAYGVEPLVEKLVQNGANVNCVNSFGYSCLLEACHRGYIVVAKFLLEGGADLSYIPSEEQAGSSPFSSAPSQSALAEASRCGFFKVVQTLLDAGAPKDLPNRLGWTALHEACFYNRIETAKTLLLGGANAGLRTRLGALPFHLACLPEIRNMLQEMGGDQAVPTGPGDKIDMLQILTELTMPEGQSTQNDDDDDEGNTFMIQIPLGGSSGSSSGGMTMSMMQFAPRCQQEEEEDCKVNAGDADAKPLKANISSGSSSSSEDKNTRSKPKLTTALSSSAMTVGGGGVIKTVGGLSREEAEGGGAPQQQLLHSGPLLGNLPALNGHVKQPFSSSPKKFQSDLDNTLLSNTSSNSTGNTTTSLFANNNNNSIITKPFHAGGNTHNNKNSSVSWKADEKIKSVSSDSNIKGGKRGGGREDSIPADMPATFICQLTHRPMSEPVRTVYGNIYDKTAIVQWLNTQGKICPLTGAPLSEVDLVPMEELGNEIRSWVLQRSMANNNNSSSDRVESSNATTTTGKVRTSQEDDLYDF